MSCEDSATKDRPRLFESGAVSLPNEDELTVIQATGIYSSADIWFSVPVAWKENVVIHLYARLGTMRVPLAIIAVRDVPSVEAGGMISGVAISTRGRPCSGFEVTIQRGPGVPTANGFIAMNAWSASESPEIVGGAPFGEFSFAPARGQVDVSLVGGKVGDAGEPNDRFAFLRVDGGGVVSVNVQDAVTVLPGAGNFGVEGTGTAGTPSGGVLTVQGTGTGGRVTVVGSEAGGALNVTVANDSFSVYGKETPADFSENPDNCVNVSAHLLGWGDEKWSRVGLTPAGDTVANPSNCVNAAGFIHGWDGSVWKRARMQTVSSVSAISNATAPAGVATAAFPYAYDAAGNQWLRTRCDGNGVLYTSQLGGNALADNLNFSGNLVPNSWALQAHRNQAGNWYLSRGGYNGVIAAAAVPAIANSIAAGAHNTTPPAPTNGDATALQVDGRGNLVVVQGKPSGDARDAASVSTFKAVASGNIKNAAGNLLSLEALHAVSAGTVYLCLVNKTSTPASPDPIFWRMKVAANAIYRLDRAMLSDAGIRFTSGIGWAFSTDPTTVTLVTTVTDVCVNATYA